MSAERSDLSIGRHSEPVNGVNRSAVTGAAARSPYPGAGRGGTASDHAEATELMARALRRRSPTPERPALAAAIDRVAVPQGNWTYPDPARLVAERSGPGRPGPTWSSWASPSRR